jgi:dihydroorotase
VLRIAHLADRRETLDRLEGFASLHGARWYGVPPNEGTVTLARGHRPGPARVASDEGEITVFDPGFPIAWHITNS